MDAFARQLYGDAWDPARGIIHSAGNKRLKDFVSPLDEEKLRNPDIRYFAERNPGHHQGDMMVCMAHLTLENWASVLKRTAGRMLRTRRPAAAR